VAWRKFSTAAAPAACLLALAGSAACRRADRTPASELNVADPARARQLLYGFYDVETAPNRWAAREFAVALRPPPGAGAHGATLRLRFFVPGPHIETTGPITVRADLDGWAAAPRTFSEGGFHDYVADVPAEAVDTNIVAVRFILDKALGPPYTDGRELGAVVADVGLRASR
jgi:hypothetical protein